ncbi:protein phosphatase 2C domain-containing protein [Rarobacter faecitabidus]|uniref:Protein phosphatase n=1 Tax=Rarobacter faecitabidus TaxID=13243 RepID=A0A542ZTS4_RARFA|nr:protein phosphatase 2C domain-containing protein [Rarobacter faecitabidus]TQL63752.1 protein phosphatase [Rarobacter faecitabidus]
MTRLDVRVAAVTDPGRVRSHNEDAILADGTVFAVADGMGGHEAGEVASAAAVETLARIGREGDGTTPEAVIDAIEDAQANVLRISGGGPRGAGSTLAGIAAIDFAEGPHWLVFNIGDSRVYRFADGALRQLTVDHSLVQELVADGMLTPEEARTSPRRNVITRALGSADFQPTLLLLPVTNGERILICSDGLTNELPDEQIAATFRDVTETDRVAEILRDAALAAGGRDNISAIVVDVVEGGLDASGVEFPDEDTAPTRRT